MSVIPNWLAALVRKLSLPDALGVVKFVAVAFVVVVAILAYRQYRVDVRWEGGSVRVAPLVTRSEMPKSASLPQP